MKDSGNTRAAPVRVARIEWFPIRIPLPKPLQWASLRETAADYMLLKITTDNGLVGVAEGSAKVPWTGATLRSLAVVFEEMFVPALRDVDLVDEAAVVRAVRRPREHTLAKAMIDVACWDIRSQMAGRPLWRLWGGQPRVRVCWVVTRQAPVAMAKDAEDMVARHGFRTLKVKGGQGVAADLEALTAIRHAVGESVALTVDANGHYSAAEAPAYVAKLAEHGIAWAEDPCRLEPTASFTELQAACPLPILVDGPCRDVMIAKLFLERGARGLSIKLSKAGGYTENRAIVELAGAHDCSVNVGILAETSLGALAALQLQAAIPQPLARLPAETTFFLTLDREYVQAPLTVDQGEVRLPDTVGMDRMIDWRRVAALAP
jgi:L-alanine-DL-glutamate epimerase-like enolase superfamily enzyme